MDANCMMGNPVSHALVKRLRPFYASCGKMDELLWPLLYIFWFGLYIHINLI